MGWLSNFFSFGWVSKFFQRRGEKMGKGGLEFLFILFRKEFWAKKYWQLSLKHLWNFFETSLKLPWNTIETFLKLSVNNPKNSLKHYWNFKHHSNFLETLLKLFRNRKNSKDTTRKKRGLTNKQTDERMGGLSDNITSWASFCS